MALGIERDPQVKPFLEELAALMRKHRVVIVPPIWLAPMLEVEARNGKFVEDGSPAEFLWQTEL